jgi:hypothetical protein
MITALLVPLLALGAPADAPKGPARARIPADVPMAGVLELTRQGEVALLPLRNKQPFNALLITRTKQACAGVAHDMMDVETWNKRWDIDEAIVLERTPTSVRYEIKLGLALAPRIPGFIEHPDANHVIFNDPKTKAQFIWTLDDIDGGCALRYSMLETPGKPSGYVAVIQALEPTAVDAGNFAAGLSSSRGFARPEEPRAQITQSGESAFAQLAAHGIALRVKRAPNKFPVIITRRVIDKTVDEVAWSIRDKRRYEDKIEVVKGVKDRGNTSKYDISAFGGSVTIETAVVESGDLHTNEGLTLTERVTGGDLDAGSGEWVWKIRPVPGGTDVELTWNVDVAEGSALMRTMARADPVARESLAIHMALALASDLIGGKPLGTSALAQAQ